MNRRNVNREMYQIDIELHIVAGAITFLKSGRQKMESIEH